MYVKIFPPLMESAVQKQLQGCPKERSQVSLETAMKIGTLMGFLLHIGQFLVENGMIIEEYLPIAVRYWVRLLEEELALQL